MQIIQRRIGSTFTVILFIFALVALVSVAGFAPPAHYAAALSLSTTPVGPDDRVTLTGSAQIVPIHSTMPVTPQITLVGTVNVRARDRDIQTERVPSDVVIILDGSNSMNWNRAGKGSYIAGISDPALASYAAANGDIDCIALLSLAHRCQSSEAYKDYAQRGIYHAKQIIKEVLNNTAFSSADRVALVTFSGGNAAPATLTNVYPETGLAAFNALLVDQLINQAASMHPGSTDPNELYTTAGGSPGALGFARTRQVFNSAPNDTHRNRVVIMLTDGLMNVFLNGQQNMYQSPSENYDPTEQQDLPVNQAIEQANLIKNVNNPRRADIYVTAFGNNITGTGLDQIPSASVPPYLISANYTATDDAQIANGLIDDIPHEIDQSCDPFQEDDQVPDASRTFRMTGPDTYISETDPATGHPSLGKVTVSQAGSLVATVNINTDGSFAISNLLPNTDYTLSFNNPDEGQPVFYMGLDKPDPQYRNYARILDTGTTEMAVHIDNANGGTTQFVHPNNAPVILTLNGTDVCALDSAQDGRVNSSAQSPVATTEERLPKDIVIVMDASGSMNWTWDGKGSVGPNTSDAIRQHALPDGTIPCAALLALPVGCQSSEAYTDYQQRRLYQVKQAIKDYLQTSPWGPQDRVALVTYNGGYSNGSGDASALTKLYPATGMTTDVAGLEADLINEAGSKNPHSSDPALLYTTLGSSPGALALQRAKQVLDSALDTGPRQRQVIFLTDGLQNVFVDGQRSSADTLAVNYDPTDQQALPINQAIEQANLIKDATNPKRASVFAFALGTTFDQSTWLGRIASEDAPPFLGTASTETQLDELLQGTWSALEPQPCPVVEEQADVPLVYKMARRLNNAYVAETNASGQPREGVVTVRDAGGNVVAHADIQPDGTWSVPNLLPNTSYTLSFNRLDDDPVFYQGRDNQYHNYSIVASTGSDQLVVQTQSIGIQALPAPVVLVTSDDCKYTAPPPSVTPSPSETATLTSTVAPSDTPSPTETATTNTIPSTPTSDTGPATTATATTTPTLTATANQPSAATYHEYIPFVLHGSR